MSYGKISKLLKILKSCVHYLCKYAVTQKHKCGPKFKISKFEKRRIKAEINDAFRQK